MQSYVRSAFAFLAAALLAGCHARWNPIASAPAFSVSHESADGTLNKKQDATLSDEDNHYIAGFRYEIPGRAG